jgi:hypothetical protein
MEYFEPVNELEKKLIAAATDPSEVPAFLDFLLLSQIIIVPVGEKPAIVNGVLGKDTTIAIEQVSNGNMTFTTFYSSENRLPSGTEYLQFSARDFFELTKGYYLVLNPGLAYGKEFYPNEIEWLLKGGNNRPLSRRIVEKDTQILIGKPKEYPHALADALTRLFSKRPSIKSAYLVQYFDPSSSDKPGLLIGVEIDTPDKFDKLSAEIGTIISAVSIPQAFADVIRVSDNNVFAGTNPFYQTQKTRNWLRRFLG